MFLDEAFGGLVRSEHMSKNDLLKRFESDRLSTPPTSRKSSTQSAEPNPQLATKAKAAPASALPAASTPIKSNWVIATNLRDLPAAPATIQIILQDDRSKHNRLLTNGRLPFPASPLHLISVWAVHKLTKGRERRKQSTNSVKRLPTMSTPQKEQHC
jgi:hypothetical protein